MSQSGVEPPAALDQPEVARGRVKKDQPGQPGDSAEAEGRQAVLQPQGAGEGVEADARACAANVPQRGQIHEAPVLHIGEPGGHFLQELAAELEHRKASTAGQLPAVQSHILQQRQRAPQLQKEKAQLQQAVLHPEKAIQFECAGHTGNQPSNRHFSKRKQQRPGVGTALQYT